MLPANRRPELLRLGEGARLTTGFTSYIPPGLRGRSMNKLVPANKIVINMSCSTIRHARAPRKAMWMLQWMLTRNILWTRGFRTLTLGTEIQCGGAGIAPNEVHSIAGRPDRRINALTEGAQTHSLDNLTYVKITRVEEIFLPVQPLVCIESRRIWYSLRQYSCRFDLPPGA